MSFIPQIRPLRITSFCPTTFFSSESPDRGENVGRNFAKIAREIHEGDAPERSIIGEATPKETLELIEDEIPVTPLPWFNRKSH